MLYKNCGSVSVRAYHCQTLEVPVRKKKRLIPVFGLGLILRIACHASLKRNFSIFSLVTRQSQIVYCVLSLVRKYLLIFDSFIYHHFAAKVKE